MLWKSITAYTSKSFRLFFYLQNHYVASKLFSPYHVDTSTLLFYFILFLYQSDIPTFWAWPIWPLCYLTTIRYV